MNKILITGIPGSGKTYSLHSLPPKETLLIQGEPKLAVPKKGYGKMYTNISPDGKGSTIGNLIVNNSPYASDNKTYSHTAVFNIARKRGFKYVVFDDVNYFMQKAIEYFKNQVKGDQRQAYQRLIGYVEDFFNSINLLNSNDICVIIIWQKYIDKLGLVIPGVYYNETSVPQGKFDITLEAEVDMEGRYYFRTNGYGMSRSPEGMFNDVLGYEDNKIPNDIMSVIKAMKEY